MKIPDNWPFRTYNSVQTPKSALLEQAKFRKTKTDLQDVAEVLF